MRYRKTWTLIGALLLPLGACADDPAQTAEPELGSVVVTQWNDSTELFLEYPHVVAGQELPAPVRRAGPEAELVGGRGHPERLVARLRTLRSVLERPGEAARLALQDRALVAVEQGDDADASEHDDRDDHQDLDQRHARRRTGGGLR